MPATPPSGAVTEVARSSSQGIRKVVRKCRQQTLLLRIMGEETYNGTVVFGVIRGQTAAQAGDNYTNRGNAKQSP